MMMMTVALVGMMDGHRDHHHWVDIHIPGVVVELVDNVDDGRGVVVPRFRSVGCGLDVALFFFLVCDMLNIIPSVEMMHR